MFPFDFGPMLAPDTLSEDYPGAVQRVFNSDGTWYDRVRLYNATGSALTANAVYRLSYDGDEETIYSAVACASGTQRVDFVVVADEAVAATSFGWFAFRGVHDVLVQGATDVAKDDFLELVAATTTTALIKDGTSRTQNSVAIACAAQTSATETATRCVLLGAEVLLAES